MLRYLERHGKTQYAQIVPTLQGLEKPLVFETKQNYITIGRVNPGNVRHSPTDLVAGGPSEERDCTVLVIDIASGLVDIALDQIIQKPLVCVLNKMLRINDMSRIRS